MPALLVALHAALAGTLWSQEGRGANEARVDLSTKGARLELLEHWPPSAVAERMGWLSEVEQPGTFTVTAAIHDFAPSRLELLVRADRDCTLQVELRGPWVSEDSGDARQHFVAWTEARVEDRPLDGFRAGLAWHDEPIQCSLGLRAGEPVCLRLAAEVPAQWRAPVTWRPADDAPAFGLARQFRKGVNLGNFLEVPPGEDWGDNTIQAEDLRQIAAEGFDHVRIPVGWHHHCGPAPEYRLHDRFVQEVTGLLDEAGRHGLAAIVNVHHFHAFTDHPDRERDRLFAIWRQVAVLLRDRPLAVALEILNEPCNSATTEVMNRIYAELIPEIRQIDPRRAIIVGPGNFNRIAELSRLRLPPDDRLIVSVHSYEPHWFTHQGAAWSGEPGHLRGVVFPGPPMVPVAIPAGASDWLRTSLEGYNATSTARNPCSVAALTHELELAAAWARHWNRPLYLGEFGVFPAADPVSREGYCRAMRSECERLGIGWCMWDWKASFCYWDRAQEQPLPGLRDALFGPPLLR